MIREKRIVLLYSDSKGGSEALDPLIQQAIYISPAIPCICTYKDLKEHLEAAVFRVFEQRTVHLRGQGNFQKLLSWFKFKMTISFRKQSCLKNAYKASLCGSTFPTAGKFELFFAFLKTIAGILGQRVNISFLVSRLYLLAYIFTVVWMYHFFFL